MQIKEIIEFLKANDYQFEIMKRHSNPKDFKYYQNKLGYYRVCKNMLVKRKHKINTLPR